MLAEGSFIWGHVGSKEDSPRRRCVQSQRDYFESGRAALDIPTAFLMGSQQVFNLQCKDWPVRVPRRNYGTSRQHVTNAQKTEKVNGTASFLASFQKLASTHFCKACMQGPSSKLQSTCHQAALLLTE